MSATAYRDALAAAAPKAENFSLVLGGPLFQLLRRLRLSDDALGLAHRRIICAVLIMWAPLLVLSAMQGDLAGPPRATPFIDDVGFHLRLLIAAPLLILAEPVVHLRLRVLVGQFQGRGLVRPNQTERFEAAVTDAMRLRNSAAAEAAMIALVYLVGVVFTVRRYESLGAGAWYASAAGSGRLSPAGLWLVFGSLEDPNHGPDAQGPGGLAKNISRDSKICWLWNRELGGSQKH